MDTVRRSIIGESAATGVKSNAQFSIKDASRQEPSLTGLSMEDLHLLERYQSRARAEGWSQGTRSTSRLGGSQPTTPDPNSETLSANATPVSNWPSRSPALHATRSRDYISLRSGTPLSTVEQTPPPPPPASSKPSARSPLSAQNPWSAHRSIRHVGSHGEETASITSLFTPLPLELDLSPLDIPFERLVIDAPEEGLTILEPETGKQGGTGILGEPLFPRDVGVEKDLPSRPKLVHFATTPSLARYAADSSEHLEDEAHTPAPVRAPRRVVTPAPRPSGASSSLQRPRVVTPIRNMAAPAASPSKGSTSRRSSWTQDIRSSIQRDLTPPNPSPRRRSRPDPALFPGVIPYSFSPREIGRRKQEKEWKRYHQLENVRERAPGSRARKGWSWNGRSAKGDGEVWRDLEGELEARRREEEDGWEVLQ